MKLLYIYINQFRNIFNQEVYCSDEYCFSLKDKVLKKNYAADTKLRNVIYGDSFLKNLHIFVGKTGSGKTNLLQLIGREDFFPSDEQSSYFLLFKEKEDDNNFIFELHNFELGIPIINEKNTYYRNAVGLYRVKMQGDSIVSLSPIEPMDARECLIINCFDRHSFGYYPYYDEVHYEGSSFIRRHISPFDRTNVGIACEWIKRYVSSFPETSVKRKAALIIKSSNWAKRYSTPVDKELVLSQYWTCKDIEDKIYDGLSHKVEKYAAKLTVKQKFLHDLLADYALYLREYLEQFCKEELDRDIEGGIYDEYTNVVPSNKPNPFHSPDHWGTGSIPNLLTRIKWLSMVIDRNTDGGYFYNGKGLVWQISSDIFDIYNLLNKLPDKLFTIDTLSIPIIDIVVGKGTVMEDLFERMTGYRPDENNLFDRELLPYSISCLSSGEYQFAKVLGAIDEYCVRLKLSSSDYKDVRIPDFILLLDEPETYMHPDMARRFIYEMGHILKDHTKESELQVIMSTHNPFLLSDVTSSQITKLDFDKECRCVIAPTNKQTFASEIHSIMANDFFLNFTIGEYSRAFLENALIRLREIVSSKKRTEYDEQFLNDLNILIPQIGDNLLRAYFETLMDALR